MTAESVAPSSASEVGDKVGDAMLQTEEEIAENHCCTCRKPVDYENSLVIVRANGKSPDIRRCRSCHNVRSAINRLTKNHGSLVKDFSKVSGSKLEAFYKDHGHLRGDDLRVKVEEVVQDWKTSTTRIEFNQEAEYLDEDALRKKYVDKPEIAENIILNGKRFFCPIKKLTLYADPSYKSKVQDAIEHGTSHKRKGQAALKDDAQSDEPLPKKGRGNKGKAKGKAEGKDDSNEPKLKAGEKKKLTKKIEAAVAKSAVLKDHIDRANRFGDMIPKYVLDAGHKVLGEMMTVTHNAEEKLESGTGAIQPVLDDIEKHIEVVNEATQRIKAQMDSAAAFK